MFLVRSSWLQPLQKLTWFVSTALKPSQLARAVTLPVGCCSPHPPSPFIIIINVPESWYSFCLGFGKFWKIIYGRTDRFIFSSHFQWIYMSHLQWLGFRRGSPFPQIDSSLLLWKILNMPLDHPTHWSTLCQICIDLNNVYLECFDTVGWVSGRATGL